MVFPLIKVVFSKLCNVKRKSWFEAILFYVLTVVVWIFSLFLMTFLHIASGCILRAEDANSGLNLSCPSCGMPYQTLGSVRRHFKRDHAPDTLSLEVVCSICSESFTDTKKFNLHVKKSYPDRVWRGQDRHPQDDSTHVRILWSHLIIKGH